MLLHDESGLTVGIENREWRTVHLQLRAAGAFEDYRPEVSQIGVDVFAIERSLPSPLDAVQGANARAGAFVCLFRIGFGSR